jgi:hypothetical protein
MSILICPVDIGAHSNRQAHASHELGHHGLEAGVLLFAGGLTLLYLNPFWHFDEGGFLDWRVHWWECHM